MNKPRPVCRPDNVDAIPQEMKARPAWLVWRYELRDGKWTKVPYNARSGTAASSTDPKTWAAFPQAYAMFKNGHYDGIGFVIAAGGGWVGVDVDHCRDEKTGELDETATDIKAALSSYSEISPSGTGVRIFCKGTLPPQDRKQNNVEMYDTARYLTVTGHHIQGTPRTVEERTEALADIHARYVARPERVYTNGHSPTPPPARGTQTDGDVLMRAGSAANGAKFNRLWSGDTSDYAGDESKADMALCGMLAFWCAGDPVQIDRLFRRSALMRDKWDSRRGSTTYGGQTIERVLDGKSDFYDPRQFFVDTATPHANGKHPASDAAADPAPAPQETAAHIPAADYASTELKSDLLTAGKHWIERYGADWGYDAGLGAWYQWRGTHWQMLGTRHPILDSQASLVLRELGMPVSSIGRIDGVIRMSATGCMRSLGAAPGLVNFANGTLDTRPGVPLLGYHSRDDGLTYCLPYEYAPGPYPKIEEFITSVIPDPKAIRAYMVHIGLALLGDTRLHRMVLIIGQPRSGKSTLLRLANLVCGQDRDGFAGAALFDRQSEGLRSRAVWSSYRLVCIDELPVEALRDEELAKAMSAHSGVEMRRLHQHERTDNQWRPKLMMNTNEAPRYTDRSGALTERLVVIRCPWGRLENQRDKYLADTFPPELAGFAAACIDAALELLASPFADYPISPEMRAELAEIEREGDALKLFVSEECKLDPEAWVTSATLYEHYRRFCQDNGNQPVSMAKLAGSLNARWSVDTKSRRVEGKITRGLQGIRMLEEGERL